MCTVINSRNKMLSYNHTQASPCSKIQEANATAGTKIERHVSVEIRVQTLCEKAYKHAPRETAMLIKLYHG